MKKILMFLLGLLLCIFAVLSIEQYSNKVSKERHEKEVLQAKQDSIWLAEEREEQIKDSLKQIVEDSLLQIRKDSINKVIDELRTKEKKYPLSQEQQELMESYNEAARKEVDAKYNSNTERMWYGLPPANSGAADAFANSFK